MAGSSVLVVQGHMIRKWKGRADLYLYVDKARKDLAITYSSYHTVWLDGAVFWMGKVSAGRHSVHLQSNLANAWGCKTNWFVPRERVCIATTRGSELPMENLSLGLPPTPIGPAVDRLAAP